MAGAARVAAARVAVARVVALTVVVGVRVAWLVGLMEVCRVATAAATEGAARAAAWEVTMH